MLDIDPIQCVRETHVANYLPPRGYALMPLEQHQTNILRGILYSLEQDHITPETRRAHIDALKRCIAEMEDGNPQSPVWWAAGALRGSMRKEPSSGIYIVTDRTLQTWALDRIFELFPDSIQ